MKRIRPTTRLFSHLLLPLLVGWLVLTSSPGRAQTTSTTPERSVARFWNEQLLGAIRSDKPHPPVHARNLFSLSLVMYDTWAALDPVAAGVIYHGRHPAFFGNEAFRNEAVSYAAFRMLQERIALSRSAAVSLPVLMNAFRSQGLDPSNESRDPTTAAGLGNRIYDTVSAWFLNDGAEQLRSYADLPVEAGGYAPRNPPLDVTSVGAQPSDPNRWQPLHIPDARDQNGLPAPPLQTFLGSQWLRVRPFALDRTLPSQPWIDPGPPPQLGTDDTQVRDEVVAVLRASSELTPDDGVRIDISPGSQGNNPLGANTGIGWRSNPATGAAYVPQLVLRGDFTRVLAEYWADGPTSETPPGHWNLIANRVTDLRSPDRKIGGTGPSVPQLEWDVKLYLALNAALHDAACAAWSLKRYHDGWRPLSMIRFMGGLGQSSDPAAARYHRWGLPIIPGLIESATSETTAPQQRHEGLEPGQIVVRTYAGPPPPDQRSRSYSGVRWIHATQWLPYQKAEFVTPAFPGYISGHSTFSRAAAEVMAAFTGSHAFPGGLFESSIPARGLTMEAGPTRTITLQWATYSDAADQAGQSRVWGGIHPPVDDVVGRRIGARVGTNAWALVRGYFSGSLPAPRMTGLRWKREGEAGARVATVRGRRYQLAVSPQVEGPYAPQLGTATVANDASTTLSMPSAGSKSFFKAVDITDSAP